MGSFSDTSRAGFFFFFFFKSGEFLLHIPCWIYFSVGSFSYTSITDFVFMWGVSLTHPILPLFLSGEFLLHIPCWLLLFFSPRFLFSFFYLGSFSYTYRTGLIFSWGSFSYTSHDGFIFIGGVSLTHPVLASFLSGEFLLHIPCWFRVFFYRGSFSYTSPVGFIYIWGVSLTHPVPFLLLLLFFFYYLGSFSYTSHDGFTFLWGVSLTHPVLAFFFFLIWGVSLTHPMLDLFFSREFFVHIHC